MPNNTAQPFINNKFGFTLIEVLTATAVLAVVVTIPILFSWRSIRSNQALHASAESFSNQIKIAHIYAREAKDSKAWGVKKSGDDSYQIISGTGASTTIVSTLTLEPKINFVNDNFTIWFNVGTGETDSDWSIEMENINGRKARVDVYKTGLIETGGIY